MDSDWEAFTVEIVFIYKRRAELISADLNWCVGTSIMTPPYASTTVSQDREASCYKDGRHLLQRWHSL